VFPPRKIEVEWTFGPVKEYELLDIATCPTDLGND